MPTKRLVVGAMLLLLSACGREPGVQPGVRPSTDGTLVLTSLTDVDALNDLISNGSTQGRDVERFLFLRLMRENADFEAGPPSYSPQLAESWESSPDGRALTFHLREASWSDGAPITADDVRWSWQAQTDPDVAWRYSRRKAAIEDVEVVDARTVRFHFLEVNSDQLDDANEGPILPKHAWGELPFSEWRSSGGWFVDHFVSSGPFALERWEPNQELVLERNPHYYEPDRPRVERLAIRIIPEKTSQVSQILGGALDYVTILPPDQIERVESSDILELDAFWGRQFDYLCWNIGRPPLDRVEIRRALAQAIDRQGIVDSIYRGFARVAVSPVLSSTWAFDHDLEPWPYAPREAERLLAASGYDVEAPLKLELLIQNGNRVHLDAATLIQAQLARVGVELRLRPLEFQTWVERVTKHDFEVAIGGWEIPTSLDMSFAFHTEEIGKYNFGSYSNPELDRLLEQARSAGDLEEKRRLLHRVQNMLHQEQPYTFLWEPQKLNARHVRVRDSRPNLLSSYYNIDEWWLDGDR